MVCRASMHATTASEEPSDERERSIVDTVADKSIAALIQKRSLEAAEHEATRAANRERDLRRAAEIRVECRSYYPYLAGVHDRLAAQNRLRAARLVDTGGEGGR